MSKEKTRQLHKDVAPFTGSNKQKSIIQLCNTILPFFILWFLAYQSLSISIFITIPLAVIAAGFIVRTFIIFHDCTHGSFFKSKKANKFFGTLTGIITLFPYEKWKREHLIHHASSSNLDKRGIGDIWVMTVDEYISATKWQRFVYRVYRNPVVLFGLGPIYLVLIASRFNRKDAKLNERLNTHFISLAVVAIYTGMIFLIGWQAFLIIQGTITFVAASLGIWLFYIQHTFEDSYFEEESEWDYVKAAIEGSSFYKLPRFLQWITGNIGYHHVHHLSPRVPNYNLEEAHNATPPLHNTTTITITTSLASLKYRLYDEDNHQFIGFKPVHKQMRKRITIDLEKLKELKPKRTSFDNE